MLKKIISVRGILTILLLLSVAAAAVATYYKIVYWGLVFVRKSVRMFGRWTPMFHSNLQATR